MFDEPGSGAVRDGRFWIVSCVLGIAVSAATIALAQDGAQQIIQHRIASFREIGTAFKNIKDELELKQPDLQKLQASARLIQDRGTHMREWFPPGSEPPPRKGWVQRMLDWFSSDEVFALVTDEVKSHAKPLIWTRRADFEQKYGRFEAEAPKMEQAVRSGAIATITSQFEKLGESCKGCHDVYREALD